MRTTQGIRTISLRDLRNDTSAVLRDVEAGERIIIAKNGSPIAELCPLGKPTITGEEWDAFLATLPPQDWREWRADADAGIDDDLDDPWERAGRR
jgi:prevent-host-death family protein